VLSEIIEREKLDYTIAIGPMPMMRAVAELTRPHAIKTEASMNPIMVDGTGMCGACRVSVGGEVKFACVEGPDFDAHEIDFDEVINRSKIYKEHEQKHSEHSCNLVNKAASLEKN
jgi:ferredoxin--NADP+ reductase